MNLRERYRPIALASNLLVITSFCVLVPLLAIHGGLSLINVAIGSGIILTTNLVFVVSGIFTPNLVPSARMAFPLNITLPIVFSAWGLVVAFFTWRIGNPLEPTLEVFREFAALFRPWEWGLFPLAQVIAMTIAVANARKSNTEEVDAN